MAGATNFQYKHITASTLITAQPQAILHSICINTGVATAVVTVADAASAATTPAIAIYTVPAGGAFGVYQSFDVQVNNGIYITIATAAADVTVTYR